MKILKVNQTKVNHLVSEIAEYIEDEVDEKVCNMITESFNDFDKKIREVYFPNQKEVDDDDVFEVESQELYYEVLKKI